jgi:hypothetical protein
MTPHASPLVQLGIPALAVAVLALWALGIGSRLGKRSALLFSLGAAAWLAVSGALAQAGYFAQLDGFPPRFLFLLLPTLLLPVLLGLSRVGDALAGAPIAALVALQGFRLPLELVMHRAAAEGTMPAQMTFTGANFDIVTGTSALLVAGLAASGHAPRWLLLGWNALGSLLLFAILVIAIVSLPAFAAFGHEPERLNTWVAYFPYAWLPAGLVSSALLGHLLLWRRLLGSNPL